VTTKAFTFRLETVLRVRRVEETRAREVLGATTRQVSRRMAELRRAQASCDALPSVLPPMTPAAFEAFRERARWLAESAARAAEELQQAVVEHALAREEMIAAKRRVSALERLAERRFREWQDEFARAEMVELDDVVNSRTAALRIEASEQRPALPAAGGRRGAATLAAAGDAA